MLCSCYFIAVSNNPVTDSIISIQKCSLDHNWNVSLFLLLTSNKILALLLILFQKDFLRATFFWEGVGLGKNPCYPLTPIPSSKVSLIFNYLVVELCIKEVTKVSSFSWRYLYFQHTHAFIAFLVDDSFVGKSSLKSLKSRSLGLHIPEKYCEFFLENLTYLILFHVLYTCLS